MIADNEIPSQHQVILAAAVKAALGERATIREILQVPVGPSFKVRVNALHYGIRTFWDHWTGRHANRSLTTDETED